MSDDIPLALKAVDIFREFRNQLDAEWKQIEQARKELTLREERVAYEIERLKQDRLRIDRAMATVVVDEH
jgi:hypothetical protein